ncbi:hypothetical protein BH09BAC1_BH09BAC1_12030 [soil metagenome]
MKQTYIWIAFVLLLTFNIILLLRLNHINKRIDVVKREGIHTPHAKEEHDHQDHASHEEADVEVAVTMGHIQRHANKLFFAGQNANWPLAGFYVHEIEESMEEVADGHVVDDGVNISQLMESLGIPALEGLEKSIEAKNKTEFNTAYTHLVNTCNTCHQSANHPYIVIQNPKTPALDNQVY